MGWFQRLHAPKGSDNLEDYEPPSGIPSPSEATKLVLYKTDWCPFCHRVFRQVEALGLSEVVEYADVASDPEASRALTQVTGRRTVPCLFINGVPFFESVAINRWLAAYAHQRAGASS